jgi:hypothetical protein
MSTASLADDTMKHARDEYFRHNGFGPNGGYDEAWVDFKLGSLPFPFPNSRARKSAVPFHDLHHLVTGYATDFRGEAEISAWEIGAGCKTVWFAWMNNLGGLLAGMMIAPRATARAFARGLDSHTLYGESYDELLGQRVHEVRDRLGLSRPTPHVSARSAALLGVATLVGLLSGALQLALLLPLVPFGLLAGHWQKQRAPVER